MPLFFINRFFYPDHSATSQLLSDLAFELASNSPSVTVLTTRQCYEDAKALLPAEEVIGGVRVLRIWTTRFGRSNLLGRTVDYLTFYIGAGLRLIQLSRRGDVIVAKTDPPMLSVMVAPIARLKGARLVNWLQDLFPEIAEAVGGGNTAMRWLYALLRSVRNVSLRAADINVVLGDRMAERVEAARARVTIIPNWSDGQAVRPVARSQSSLRKEWGLEDAFVVGYSGNLGRAHEYRTLIEAIALGQDYAAPGSISVRIVWLFIGGGALYDRFRQEVNSRGLTNVMFKPYQPRECLSESLSVANVHLITLRPELEGLIVPSKFYGVAAVGRPTVFIGDAQGEIATLVARHECGVSIEEGQSRALWEAIVALAADPARCETMGTKARRAFEAYYDKPIAMKAWKDVLRNLQAGNVVTASPMSRD